MTDSDSVPDGCTPRAAAATKMKSSPDSFRKIGSAQGIPVPGRWVGEREEASTRNSRRLRTPQFGFALPNAADPATGEKKAWKTRRKTE